MKEIVIISGKGGTGKTSITASFAYLGGKDIVVADCDVDAADLHILMKPEIKFSEDFYSSEVAVINQDACTKCGECAEICRFDAIPFINGQYVVSPFDCEGCAYCSLICPTKTIDMIQRKDGQWFISNTKVGNIFVHAKLGIGTENSGKLVAKVKNEAQRLAKENNKDFIVVDGSPGIGCPVVSSLSGANYVVLVTEPTVSGLHDLERVYELVKRFNIKAACIINKYDLNKNKTNKIMEFLERESIAHIVNLPYDETFTKAMTNGKTIVEFGENKLKDIVIEAWEKIKYLTKEI